MGMKTRLALAAAADLADAYPDGVVFIDLAPVRDDRLVMATIAPRTGPGPGGRPRESARIRRGLRTLASAALRPQLGPPDFFLQLEPDGLTVPGGSCYS
jgi:hypothetical protein